MARIRTKKELHFYIMADRIMNGYTANKTLKDYIKVLVFKKEPIMDYLRCMRCLCYYEHKTSILDRLLYLYYRRLYNKYELKLRVHIDENTCGYGIVVPHADSFRIGGHNSIGNYAVIQGHSYMTGSNCKVGDGLYLAIGSKMVGPLTLGDNVTVAANSLVNKSFGSNVLLAGSPATVKRQQYKSWYERDGQIYIDRRATVESLKKQMDL